MVKPLTKPPLPEGPVKNLQDALHDLHHRAGWPSLRSMARGVGCSHTTLSKLFRTPQLLSWESLERVVGFLRGDPERFRALWYEATGGPRPAMRMVGGERAHRPVPAPRAELRLLKSPAPDPSPDALTRLGKPLCGASHGDFTESLDRFEDALLELAAGAVLREAPEATRVGGGMHLIELDGRSFVLKLRADLQRDRTLRITVQDPRHRALGEPDIYTHHGIPLAESVGRFDVVRLTVPRALGREKSGLMRARLADVFATTYARLAAQTANALACLETAFDRAALDVLRDATEAGLAAPDRSAVWLLVVSRQRLAYAVDQEVVRRVLAAIAASDPVVSPAIAAFRVLTEGARFDDERVRRALRTMSPATVGTLDGARGRVAELLAHVQPGEEVVRVDPVATSDRVSLLVACPERIGDQVASALDPVRSRFRHLTARY